MGLTFGRKMRFGVTVCVHNDEAYIGYCLKSIYDFADRITVMMTDGIPWGGQRFALDSTEEIVRAFPDPQNKINLVTGDWPDEMAQRLHGLDVLRGTVDYQVVVDADEIYSVADLGRLRRYIALRPFVGQFRLRLNTYWKTRPFYRIDPPEPLRAYVVSRLRNSTRLVDIRRTSEPWRVTVPRRVAICHHFSYSRDNERIRQKLANSLHAEEFVGGWYENVWLKWDEDHSLENLHPMHPAEYKRAVPVLIGELPEVMRDHPFAEPGGSTR